MQSQCPPCSWILFTGFSYLLFVIPSGSAPVTVFNSFGPANTYDTTVAWGVSGSATPSGYRGQAEWFVPSASGDLSTITLATYRQSGSGRSNFFVAEDNGSGPGTILESFLNTVNNPDGLLTLNSALQPLLEAGLKYWLCDEPADSTTANAWFDNNQNHAPGFAFERSQWSWSAVSPPAPPSGVFSVSVTPVPEPTGLWLAAGLLFVWRLRKKQ
jgi:hypothetical protein